MELSRRGVQILRIPLEDVAKARLMESRAEVELARKFLHAGLLRNAAGKAFQAWKAYLSYLAIKHQDLFQLEGVKILRRGIGVLRKELVLALAPTTMMTQLAEKLGAREPEVVELTALALLIHEYQHNGPDPSGVLSKIPSDDAARGLIERLVAQLERRLAGEAGREPPRLSG
ncbi:PaREP1 family protein [Pyrobaculum ferrireducens]|uniref:PaREP1 family protein n=1 Tax=Pyrobaculum ferrireducens TaxID=1104324 RepID=UPI001F1F862F|nr:PaREP1 family protein [Pyrobaculum ferrireducens]